MKRREHASCTLYPKSFPWPSWYMRSAGHSSRQRHDGPSIRIGATTRFGPINSPARSLRLAVRRKDGCGESEFKNRGHGSVFGCPQPHSANRPIRRDLAIAVCAGSPYFGSAGIVTFGATGAQIKTWHSCCVAAWNLWIAPSDHVRHLKVLQKRRCFATGERLIKNAEVDHRIPLFKVGLLTAKQSPFFKSPIPTGTLSMR